MRFFTLLVLIVCLVSGTTLSQPQKQKDQLFGIVVDKNTGKPIHLVEVFIAGSTIGTVTNEKGEFSLYISNMPFRLIATHVGYKPVIQTITKSGVLKIELQAATFGISEVSVSAKNMRKKNIRLFKKHFIGDDLNNEYKIHNDSVLHFMTDDREFHAYTYSPLIVRNNYLGYTIKILIKDFYLCKKTIPSGELKKLTGAQGTILTRMTGFY